MRRGAEDPRGGHDQRGGEKRAREPDAIDQRARRQRRREIRERPRSHHAAHRGEAHVHLCHDGLDEGRQRGRGQAEACVNEPDPGQHRPAIGMGGRPGPGPGRSSAEPPRKLTARARGLPPIGAWPCVRARASLAHASIVGAYSGRGRRIPASPVAARSERFWWHSHCLFARCASCAPTPGSWPSACC